MRSKRFGNRTAYMLAFFFAGWVAQAGGQCILANPSFEVGGTGGAVFGGWEQFGQFGAVAIASHGAQAARISGPGGIGWNVSGYWQRLDSEPGEQWEATGHVRNPAENPLTGASLALVNIEWRDAGGELIDYDSFAVADASTPTDEYIEFALLSNPAPEGTVAIHFLLGVLEGPDDPSPDVYFDQVTIFSTTPPTMDEMQWLDFPGGTTLEFGNRNWRVKGPGYYGPGPNVFSNDPNCVWVDEDGDLHLTLSHRGGDWLCTEVVLEDALGYGDYIVTTMGRLDLLDLQAVLGIFLWQYGPCWDPSYLWWNPYNEIDIEYSRWGSASNEIAQFVVQPYDWPGNLERFDPTFGEDEVISHAMRWSADRVEFRVWRGGPNDESPQTTIHAWTYTGPHIPRPEQPRMHLNLWKLEGTPAADQEVVFRDFNFVPEGAASDMVEIDARAMDDAPMGRLLPLGMSFSGRPAGIRFDLTRATSVDLAVFSLGGRRVRTLSRGVFGAGVHGTSWDGRDDGGSEVASGLYLIRLAGDDFLDARRIVRVK